MLRIYEKGKQLGDSESHWVRVEAELRNKSRLIPWDVLTRPGNYLAGAYPCLAYLSGSQDKIKTITKAVEISLEASVEHLHQTGGKLINLLMHVHSGDAFAVVDELKRSGIPQRLKGYAAFLPGGLKRGKYEFLFTQATGRSAYRAAPLDDLRSDEERQFSQTD